MRPITRLSCISSLSYIKPQLIASSLWYRLCCISSLSYIKPQLIKCKIGKPCCCISSLSYIKPQLVAVSSVFVLVVFLPYPTSNRNSDLCNFSIGTLYFFLILHQTATICVCLMRLTGCISSLSYIKPQPNTRNPL